MNFDPGNREIYSIQLLKKPLGQGHAFYCTSIVNLFPASSILFLLKEPLSPRLHSALRSETKTATQNGKTTGSNSFFLAFQIKNVDSLKYTTLLGSSRLGLPRFLFGLASICYRTSINNRWSDPLGCLDQN